MYVMLASRVTERSIAPGRQASWTSRPQKYSDKQASLRYICTFSIMSTLHTTPDRHTVPNAGHVPYDSPRKRCQPLRSTAAPALAPADRRNDNAVDVGEHTYVEGKDAEQFNWLKQWYPVQATQNLDPKKPFGTKLLGKHLVVWRDGSDTWRCFEDRCPHKLAPLSQGRIEDSDGSLQCSYHGWRFGGDGRAVAIPQAADEEAHLEMRACNNKRSCVKSYPTKTLAGLIWVWPDESEDALQESQAKPPPVSSLFADLREDQISFSTGQWFVRDMPIPFDIMAENISDQSHVPFGHHGVAGNRQSQWAAHFRVWDINKRRPGPDGYTYELEWSPDGFNPPITQEVSCIAPSYIEYVGRKQPTGFTSVMFWIVPLDDLNVRVINHGIGTQPVPKAVSWLIGKRSSWLDHLLLNEIFDGDLAYLQGASVYAKQRDPSGGSWSQDYFMASNADGGAVAWRKWFNGRGRGGPTKAAGQSPLVPAHGLPRTQLLDRHAQHVSQCSSCQNGLRLLQRTQTVLKGASAAAFLGVAAALGKGDVELVSVGSAGAVLGIAGLLWLASFLHGAESKFLFSDYVHAKR